MADLKTERTASAELRAEPTGAPSTRMSRPWRRRVLGTLGAESTMTVAVLIGMIVYLSFASGFFLTEQNITNVLLQGSLLAIVSFGVTVVIISGNFDLSVGSGVALVAVTAGLVMRDTGNVALGIATGIGVGALLGLVNGLLVTKVKIPSFIVTLGTLVIARGITRVLAGGATVTGIPPSFRDALAIEFLGLRMFVWIAAAVFVLLLGLMRYTRLGVELYAVGGNREAARLTGLAVDRHQLIAFLISGLTTAVAGLALLGRFGSAQANAGMLLELYAVAAVVLGGTSLFGGRGSVARTFLGVALIAVIQNGLNLLDVDADMQMVALGLVFICASAISGFKPRKTERRL